MSKVKMKLKLDELKSLLKNEQLSIDDFLKILDVMSQRYTEFLQKNAELQGEVMNRIIMLTERLTELAQRMWELIQQFHRENKEKEEIQGLYGNF